MNKAATLVPPPAVIRPALGQTLKARQLTMMGLGSAIGAGLFLGSGVGVKAAGPAVLVSYLVAGTLVILVMRALGELAASNPNIGAFSVYAQQAFGQTAGSTLGWAVVVPIGGGDSCRSRGSGGTTGNRAAGPSGLAPIAGFCHSLHGRECGGRAQFR